MVALTTANNRQYKGMILAIVTILLCALFGTLDSIAPATHWAILFLIFQVATVSVVIWQACDPFADAAQWIGDAFLLPGSVRGATLDAVASSMPELLSGIFFVLLAIGSADADPEALAEAGAEGFGATIATCAGSAVYNMVLIPAFCALVISFVRPSRPTIDVEKEVISRDGIWFVGCQLLLIVFLFQNTMYWWMAAGLILVYAAYVGTLYTDARKYRQQKAALTDYLAGDGAAVSDDDAIAEMRRRDMLVAASLVQKVRAELTAEGAARSEDDPPDSAGFFFGFFAVPLNHVTSWVVIGCSTLVAAIACYFLVEATRHAAVLLDVPAFFVAVIVAAAASSVPDTLLAIGAARRGDDSGAVSNAFGSNIFDICICLSIPLLVNSYLTGWQPVSLMEDGRPMEGLDGLRILLVILTVITLALMWHRKQLTRWKAVVLCLLYAVFVGYAVLGSLGISIT